MKSNKTNKKPLWRLFDHSKGGEISDVTLLRKLTDLGIGKDDPRLQPIVDQLNELKVNADGIRKISKTALGELIQKNRFLHRLFEAENIIPDFQSFRKEINDIFNAIKDKNGGAVADYIPQLAKVDPNLFGVSICTVDGQIIEIGDTRKRFTIQSASKPVTYSIALEEHGVDKVHQHVGKEPSGHSFNELTLNEDGLPHNPLINAGAIMCSSMIGMEDHISERYEHFQDKWTQLAGGSRPSFSNSVYLSEKSTADRNFALAYFMREKKAFPENINMHEALDFYLQCCSTELTAFDFAKVAATYANSGINPLSNKRIFRSETIKNTLSLMSSCGMYDFSGEFAFSVGLPAKSSVSGVVWIVVPNVMGICVFSPRLDKVGNSVKGIAFAEELVKRFNFHNFDSLLFEADKKIDPRRKKYETKVNEVMSLIFAASNGDLEEVKRLHAMGVDLNQGDYDNRTALHLAVAEKQTKIINYLISHGANSKAKDRWGVTPFSDAKKLKDKEIELLLNNTN
ncbi:MAG: glutaminase A [Bacteroidota bacterium]